MKKVCKNCKYMQEFDDTDQFAGCTRYPKHITVNINHFCGEWKATDWPVDPDDPRCG